MVTALNMAIRLCQERKDRKEATMLVYLKNVVNEVLDLVKQAIDVLRAILLGI